jgi:hypothetical protein
MGGGVKGCEVMWGGVRDVRWCNEVLRDVKRCEEVCGYVRSRGKCEEMRGDEWRCDEVWWEDLIRFEEMWGGVTRCEKDAGEAKTLTWPQRQIVIEVPRLKGTPRAAYGCITIEF